ncbi:hypothetical protein [Streptomyces sp. NPDC005322]|uniref:hypothetical protein n=1 Tax=unclassified Streptomyces TaxID=2593676 RepID=UPI0033BFB186
MDRVPRTPTTRLRRRFGRLTGMLAAAALAATGLTLAGGSTAGAAEANLARNPGFESGGFL